VNTKEKNNSLSFKLLGGGHRRLEIFSWKLLALKFALALYFFGDCSLSRKLISLTVRNISLEVASPQVN